MDVVNINWGVFGLVVVGICSAIFIVFAAKRQWTLAALVVGLLHLPIAFVNCAAPFRGTLDPEYVGYNQGLIHADKGLEVGIFAFSMLLGGLACACIAVLNHPGPRNYFIVAFDAFLLLTLVPATLSGLATEGFEAFRVEFGEYLQFGGVAGFIFEVALLVTSPIIGIIWAWRRASGVSEVRTVGV